MMPPGMPPPDNHGAVAAVMMANTGFYWLRRLQAFSRYELTPHSTSKKEMLGVFSFLQERKLSHTDTI